MEPNQLTACEPHQYFKYLVGGCSLPDGVSATDLNRSTYQSFGHREIAAGKPDIINSRAAHAKLARLERGVK